jgi:hypothetical protein
MSEIFRILNIADTDRRYVNTLGQKVVYDAVAKLLADHNAELTAATNLFVAEETSDFQRRFKLPGGGYLQKRGGSAKSGATGATGQWDVAFPLEEFGAGIGGDRVSLAYMTMQELNRHLDTIFAQNVNTNRHEMLKALFRNTVFSFADEIHGTLSVQPLANNDTIVYPPVIGSDTEATENHYLVSGYAAASISDTNNPFKTIRNELEEHFGAATGGENIVVFANSAQEDEIEDLTDFDPVNDRFVVPGANTDQLTGIPYQLPGRIIGRTNGCWISVWDRVPPNYMLGIYAEDTAPKPLIKRIDPADTGLPAGLTLISKSDRSPLEDSQYSNRFGYGVGDRLNGVVMFLDAGSTYTIPTVFQS